LTIPTMLSVPDMRITLTSVSVTARAAPTHADRQQRNCR
jgi:hypothetical protein